MTILVLRYLYFGRSNLVPHSCGRQSPAPSFSSRASSSLTRHEEVDTYFNPTDFGFDINDLIDTSSNTDSLPDPSYLMPEPYFSEPLSRSPSPIPPPAHYRKMPSYDNWDRRYEIHDEAFATLFTALAAFYDKLDPVNARYIMMPVLIFALVTRPGSMERALCQSILTRFKEFVATSATHPTDFESFELSMQWEQLDAYSEATQQLGHNINSLTQVPMARSAPEWSWWDMLKHVDMDECKCSHSSKVLRCTEAAGDQLPHLCSSLDWNCGFARTLSREL
jgi:hypothetical protein